MVPRPTPEEKKALEESIRVHGQREPIIINENGEILDGHTRFEICSNFGVEPKYRIEKFETKTLEVGYVIEANLKRRHLTSFQKIELSYILYLEMKEDAIERGRSNLVHYKGKIKNTENGRTTDNLGRQIGVGRNALQMGIWLLKNTTDQQKKLLRNGQVSITSMYNSLTNIRNIRLKNNSKKRNEQDVMCPCCKSIFKKKELLHVREKDCS